MKAALPKLPALLTLCASLTMVGCSDSDDTPSAAPDIDTKHIYTRDATIYRFHPESGQSTVIDTFDPGEHKFEPMDTDPDKQGYEYALYVKDNTIRLLNYSNAAGSAVELIDSPGAHVCSIHARDSAPEQAFNINVSDRFPAFDLFIMDVALNTDASCSADTSVYYAIDFLDLVSGSRQFGVYPDWHQTSSAYVHGTMLKNHAPVVQEDPDTGATVRWGYIGYDIANGLVSFHDQNNDLAWARAIPGDGSIPRFFQAARDRVLIQSGNALYLHTIARDVFTIGQSTGDSDLPGMPPLDALFENPMLITSFADGNNPVGIATDGASFAITDGRLIHFYDSSDNGGRLLEQVFPVAPDTEILKVRLLPNGQQPRIVVHTRTTDNNNNVLHSLSIVNAQTGGVLLAQSGDDIQFEVASDELFFNVFSSATGWTASHLVNPVEQMASRRDYAQSLFAFADDRRSRDEYVLILSSDTIDASGYLVDPLVAPFSRSQALGFYTGNLLGYIEGTVRSSNLDATPNFVINDIFGGLYTEDAGSELGLHFFNLREEVSSELYRYRKFQQVF
jgi:hypothetical protein